MVPNMDDMNEEPNAVSLEAIAEGDVFLDGGGTGRFQDAPSLIAAAIG